MNIYVKLSPREIYNSKIKVNLPLPIFLYKRFYNTISKAVKCKDCIKLYIHISVEYLAMSLEIRPQMRRYEHTAHRKDCMIFSNTVFEIQKLVVPHLKTELAF